MIAIILAAGSGKRLKLDKPKGMLNIGNKPLIDYSITCLQQAGITEIIIVTGFGADYYKKYFSRIQQIIPISFCHNQEFENSGSLYSLYLALKSLKTHTDLVILDSDILYNINEFVDFIQSPFKEAVLATNVPDGRYDACYVQTNISDHLVKITKNINYITGVSNGDYWEYIGVAKTSSETIAELITYAEMKMESNGSLDHEYDYAFESIERHYRVIRYKDYVWSEVDDNEQLNYMINNVYPKLNLFY